MREGPFQELASESQPSLAASAANATTISIDGIARFDTPLPVPAPAIGFRDVATHTHGFEIHKRLVAVIPLVAHHLCEAIGRGSDHVDP